MADTLLKTQVNVYTSSQFTQIIADELGESIPNILTAITSSGGLQAAAKIIQSFLVEDIAATLTPGLQAIGIALDVYSVIEAISAYMEYQKVSKVLQEMRDHNTDKVKITTKFYHWTGGSGNYSNYYSTEEFTYSY